MVGCIFRPKHIEFMKIYPVNSAFIEKCAIFVAYTQIACADIF